MMISCMTIISALMGPRLIRTIHTKWIVVVSIGLTILGLIGFSCSEQYWMLFLFAVPYGLGAGSIDASLNHYVANNYSSSVMNFLHCFYGLGAVISPNIMGLALKYAHWNEGYRWTAYIQIGILVICVLSLPLWKNAENGEAQDVEETAGIREAVKVHGVILTLIAFFAYCAGEMTGFLWTSSYFAGTKTGMSEGLIASFGSLIFGGLMLGRLISGFISNRLGDYSAAAAGLYSCRCRISDHGNGHGAGLPGDPAYGSGEFRKKIQCGCDRTADGFCICGQHVYADAVRKTAAGGRHMDHATVSGHICFHEYLHAGNCISQD